jgi:hypothetical protein
MLKEHPMQPDRHHQSNGQATDQDMTHGSLSNPERLVIIRYDPRALTQINSDAEANWRGIQSGTAGSGEPLRRDGKKKNASFRVCWPLISINLRRGRSAHEWDQ